MPVQVARRRANSRRGSRLGRREKRGRTVNFNDELGRARAVCEFHDGFLNVVGKVDGNKPIPGVEIVLALFVNHAKHIVFFGGRILKGLINLTQLKRLFLIIVPHADSEMLRGFVHDYSSSRLIFILRLPMPCASNQCTSASVIVPSSRRTVASPFIFFQFPRPYTFTSRARIRIPSPKAITS